MLCHDFFIGFGPVRDVEAAVFGTMPGYPIVKEMMQIYKDRVFDPNKSMTLLNLQLNLLARIFEQRGFEIDGKYQEKDGMVIYPRDLFSGKNWFT